jgi:hypothetical protein
MSTLDTELTALGHLADRLLECRAAVESARGDAQIDAAIIAEDDVITDIYAAMLPLTGPPPAAVVLPTGDVVVMIPDPNSDSKGEIVDVIPSERVARF